MGRGFRPHRKRLVGSWSGEKRSELRALGEDNPALCGECLNERRNLAKKRLRTVSSLCFSSAWSFVSDKMNAAALGF